MSHLFTLILQLYVVIFSMAEDTGALFPYGSSGDRPACGIYGNKLTEDLFQYVRVLTLNCDATFSYRSSSCVRRDTCYGKWSLKTDTISLMTDRRLKRLAYKEQVSGTNKQFTDLGGTILVLKDSLITWDRSPGRTDTLYKR